MTPAKLKKARQLRKRAEEDEFWRLRLYVAGQTPKSLAAVGNLERICQEHLEGRYEIEVVDILEKPHLARVDEILAIPTLVRRIPESMGKIIGDLSDTERVLIGLQVVPAREVALSPG